MRKKWVRLKMWHDKKTGQELVSFWVNGELLHTTNLSDSSDSLLDYLNTKQKKKILDSNGSQKEETE